MLQSNGLPRSEIVDIIGIWAILGNIIYVYLDLLSKTDDISCLLDRGSPC